MEQAILEHPAVAECAVVAVPADQEAGEDEVMVFVVTGEGQHIETTELWAFADQRLPYFAVPRYLSFVDGLPKTPSEKVQKAKLREIGLEGAADRIVVTGAMPGRS